MPINDGYPSRSKVEKMELYLYPVQLPGLQHLPSADCLSASTGFSVCIVFPSFSLKLVAVFANHPWRHESLQPQEEYRIESMAGVAKPDSGSRDESLDFGGE